jgi:hypothetical protein
MDFLSSSALQWRVEGRADRFDLGLAACGGSPPRIGALSSGIKTLPYVHGIGWSCGHGSPRGLLGEKVA